ncbi:hypothetical protein AKJ16_DCAP20962 [Drosera capensis]
MATKETPKLMSKMLMPIQPPSASSSPFSEVAVSDCVGGAVGVQLMDTGGPQRKGLPFFESVSGMEPLRLLWDRFSAYMPLNPPNSGGISPTLSSVLVWILQMLPNARVVLEDLPRTLTGVLRPMSMLRYFKDGNKLRYDMKLMLEDISTTLNAVRFLRQVGKLLEPAHDIQKRAKFKSASSAYVREGCTNLNLDRARVSRNHFIDELTREGYIQRIMFKIFFGQRGLQTFVLDPTNQTHLLKVKLLKFFKRRRTDALRRNTDGLRFHGDGGMPLNALLRNREITRPLDPQVTRNHSQQSPSLCSSHAGRKSLPPAWSIEALSCIAAALSSSKHPLHMKTSPQHKIVTATTAIFASHDQIQWWVERYDEAQIYNTMLAMMKVENGKTSGQVNESMLRMMKQFMSKCTASMIIYIVDYGKIISKINVLVHIAD